MFRSLLNRSNRPVLTAIRHFCTVKDATKLKIAVCGAAGKIGQIVSLFLKQSAYPMELALHDISPNLSNITRQLNCISTRNTVEGFLGPMRMRAALKVDLLVSSENFSDKKDLIIDLALIQGCRYSYCTCTSKALFQDFQQWFIWAKFSDYSNNR